MDSDILLLCSALRHELHKNAELSCMERKTKSILIDFISKHTSLEVHDMGAWFYASYRANCDGNRRIAFRADMDALPIDEGDTLSYSSENRGVSHKCGHDGHSASLAAFALFVDRYGAKNDIFFLFQHAEENGVGAEKCCELIEKEHIDEIYGYHNMPGFPLGAVAVHDCCAACASKGLILKLEGKNAHASQPENGKNPAFALAKLIESIPHIVREAAGKSVDNMIADGRELSPMTAFADDGMLMCSIVGATVGSREDGTGTEAFGTSAGFARLMLTIRAEKEARLELLEQLVTDAALRAAEAEGLKLFVSVSDPFPETVNDPVCAEKVREAARKAGLEIAPWDEPFRSSEDFGCYTKLTQGALFYIGSGVDHAPLHTVSYDFPDELIAFSLDVFSHLAEAGEAK